MSDTSDGVTIRTNNVPRPLIYGYDLTERERAEFDYYTPEELDGAEFFRYRGQVYDASQFEQCPHGFFPADWDGYKGDSFFSGILIKYPRMPWGEVDTDHIIVGVYYV